jgi:purine-binding chemotaxis protein CheW
VEKILQLVTFRLGDEEFGIDILKVQEVGKAFDLVNVPGAPRFISGIINVRGRIIPVVDLKDRLNLSRGVPAAQERARIIIAEISGVVVGFCVDTVLQVLKVQSGLIEPAPFLAIGPDAKYIAGVIKWEERILLLLDLEKVLKEEEIAELEHMEPGAVE